MEFSFNEEQQAIADAAERVFADLCGDDAIKDIYNGAKPLHAELWAQLAESGMLGLVIDEEHGGLGMTLVELCLILEQQGRYVAPVPLLATLVECAMTIGAGNSDVLKADVLPGVAGGEVILSPVQASAGVLHRKAIVVAAEDGGALHGTSGVVPYASVAHGFVVAAATTGGAPVLLYCPAAADGVTIFEQRMLSGELAGRVEFDGCDVPVAHILGAGDAARALLEDRRRRTGIALAALQVGVLGEGLRRTAEYVSQRKQFGQPLGAFQAVSQQAANAYMAIESLRSVYWRALDDIEHGRDPALSASVAKFWVGDAGHKVAHTILHLHGGIGQDLDYPVHRYFLWGKHSERYRGTPDDMALEVGTLIAADPAAVTNDAAVRE